jgi:hypothetical protein
LNRNRVVGPYQPQVAGLLAAARSQRSAANSRAESAAQSGACFGACLCRDSIHFDAASCNL